jgi:hypothetical protein
MLAKPVVGNDAFTMAVVAWWAHCSMSSRRKACRDCLVRLPGQTRQGDQGGEARSLKRTWTYVGPIRPEPLTYRLRGDPGPGRRGTGAHTKPFAHLRACDIVNGPEELLKGPMFSFVLLALGKVTEYSSA